MMVQIERINTAEHANYITATCGSKSAMVAINHDKTTVQVICKNAAHKAWRGSGRFFDSVQDAVDGYKSAEMKSMIQAAELAAADTVPA